MLRGVCSNRISAALSVFFVLAIMFLPVVRAHAQVTGATLSGTVTDASGARWAFTPLPICLPETMM